MNSVPGVSAPADGLPADRPRAGLHALVVEDEPDLAAIVGDYLRRAGFDVTVLHDGTQAVASAQQHPPDVVVLDLGLPGLDGIEVCRQLRTFSDAYIVMLTARAAEVDMLIGDSAKARTKLGWIPEYDLKGLIEDMTISDIHLMKKEAHLKNGGYRTLNYFE